MNETSKYINSVWLNIKLWLWSVDDSANPANLAQIISDFRKYHFIGNEYEFLGIAECKNTKKHRGKYFNRRVSPPVTTVMTVYIITHKNTSSPVVFSLILDALLLSRSDADNLNIPADTIWDMRNILVLPLNPPPPPTPPLVCSNEIPQPVIVSSLIHQINIPSSFISVSLTSFSNFMSENVMIFD